MTTDTMSVPSTQITGAGWAATRRAIATTLAPVEGPDAAASSYSLRVAAEGEGLTLHQMAVVAFERGFPELAQAIEAEGMLRASDLRQLYQALSDAAFVPFPSTFTGQLALLDASLTIGTLTGPEQAAFILEAVGIGGPNAITRSLDGLDLATEADRTTGLERLRSLFRIFVAGRIDPADCGALTAGEVVQALGLLAVLLPHLEAVEPVEPS